jgi:hypothetical protein
MGERPAKMEIKKDAPPAKTAGKTAQKTVEGPQPKIVFFEGTEFDFGQAKGLDKVEHIFKFRNEGKADLNIDNVKTSCGCTAALLSAKVVPPGKTGEIKTTFNFGNRQGKQQKHIYVTSNDPENPKVSLALKGNVVPPVLVEPRSIYFTNPSSKEVKTVKITQTLDTPLEIKDVSTRLKMIEAEIKEEPPKDGKKCYLVNVSVKGEPAPGRHLENVTIETNQPKNNKINIPVRLNIRGDIEAVPNRVNFGALTAGEEVSRTITIRDRKDDPFVIENVTVDNDNVKVALKTPTESKTSHEATVSYTPEEGSRAVRARIKFYTNHPKEKTVTVHAYGYMPRHPRNAAPPSAPKPMVEK